MDLEHNVFALNERGVRHCLDKLQDGSLQQVSYGLLLHKLAHHCSSEQILQAQGRRAIVYMLHNSGIVDINQQDQNGDTALHLVLRHGDTELCEALLQCGADMFAMNNDGLSALEYAAAHPKVPPATKELIKKYKPGLWRAVKDDDLMSVRKLVNLWCRVDISKHGCTLKQAALDKGTEHIIRLILEIDPSMRLAHSVMAGDVNAATALCAGDSKLNLQFRNMGDMGATPLFYAIMQNNVTLVNLLHNKGAKIDATITFEEQDIPLYFTSLNKETDTEIIKCLTPTPLSNPDFSCMHYRGRNVVQHCIENDVSPSAVRHILTQGFPQLLSARDQNNYCAREAAEAQGKTGHVTVIDEVVHDWYLDSNSGHRKVLALQGYPYLKQALKDDVTAHEVVLSMETSSEQAKFDTELDHYQDCISRLHEAVVSGDTQAVQSQLYFPTDNPACFQQCLANSLAKGDGQPLIIKAVLRQHTRIVEILAKAFHETLKVKVDTARDPWYRTALHYAYTLLRSKDIVYLLQDYGCSDFTMDQDCRSPLVFRDHRHHPEMIKLIEYHRNQDYSQPEPDPWTARRIAVTGHNHHCHGKPHANHEHLHSNPAPNNQPSLHRNILQRILPGFNIPVVKNVTSTSAPSVMKHNLQIAGTEKTEIVGKCKEEEEEEGDEEEKEDEEEEEEEDEDEEEGSGESEDDLIQNPDDNENRRLCILI